LRKIGGGVVEAEDPGLHDRGPGGVKALGLSVFFQPEAPIGPKFWAAGAEGTVARQGVPGRSKGKILLDFISIISRLYQNRNKGGVSGRPAALGEGMPPRSGTT
jgi:hypothetical protein